MGVSARSKWLATDCLSLGRRSGGLAILLALRKNPLGSHLPPA